MNSSISSSDEGSGRGLWRRFALAFLTAAAVLTAAIVATAYALDPYDTGRSPLFEKPGVRPQGPRTANASRGRDPAFNAAVIGNSNLQLVSPERLNAATGLSFVQLTVPGTGPKEQLVVADWFLRHRKDARALVIGIDRPWCTADPAMPNDRPFPFWLYSRSPFEYLRGLVRLDTLEELPRRVRDLAASHPKRARADGYWDYEAESHAAGGAARPQDRARLEAAPAEGYIDNRSGSFPAAGRLSEFLNAWPQELAVVAVFPPVYGALLAAPGSAAAAADAACKAAFQRAVAGRRRSAVVDWRLDRPENRDPANFLDQTHYRHTIARLLERDIAEAVRRLTADPDL